MALFDQDGQVFEDLATTNGSRHWSARAYMKVLGYDDWASFKRVILKAISACALINIEPFAAFVPDVVVADGRKIDDYKLSRFACFMTALNADSKKPNVASAQVYFASLAETLLDLAIEHAEIMDRLFIREEISEREVLLSKTAAAAGVENMAYFRSAGYRGMYDMDYQSLRQLRGLAGSNRSLLDFMGKDELAGNLFRLTLTEGRLRRDGVHGQIAAEYVAVQVGKTVRRTMIEQTGIAPEELPTAQDIKVGRKGLKQGVGEFAQLDDVEGQRLIESQVMHEMLPSLSEDAIPGCPECSGGNPASHNGSKQCTSGSIASGGPRAHCTCDYCF